MRADTVFKRAAEWVCELSDDDELRTPAAATYIIGGAPSRAITALRMFFPDDDLNAFADEPTIVCCIALLLCAEAAGPG